jgi:hypothetical protein
MAVPRAELPCKFISIYVIIGTLTPNRSSETTAAARGYRLGCNGKSTRKRGGKSLKYLENFNCACPLPARTGSVDFGRREGWLVSSNAPRRCIRCRKRWAHTMIPCFSCYLVRSNFPPSRGELGGRFLGARLCGFAFSPRFKCQNMTSLLLPADLQPSKSEA